MFHSDPTREKFLHSILAQIAKGKQIAILSFVANLFVGIIEVIGGTVLQSLALKADGFHSFIDAIVSLTVWFGIKFSQRKADGKFHYGYFKFDAVFSLFAAVIMIAFGGVISYIGIETYLSRALDHGISIIGGVIALCAIAAAALLALVKDKYAKKSGLVSLRTDAYNSIKDASASIIAFVGILATNFGYYGLDSVAGLIIGVLIMVAGYFAVKSSSLVLADAYGNPTMVETIRSITTGVEGIEGIDDLRIRRNGPFLAVEMHVRVDGRITVFEADKIAQEVAMKMRENILSLGRITIKPEPVRVPPTVN